MAESAENKSQVRAWLYELMAQLETATDVDGKRSENGGGRIILDIQLKS